MLSRKKVVGLTIFFILILFIHFYFLWSLKSNHTFYTDEVVYIRMARYFYGIRNPSSPFIGYYEVFRPPLLPFIYSFLPPTISNVNTITFLLAVLQIFLTYLYIVIYLKIYLKDNENKINKTNKTKVNKTNKINQRNKSNKANKINKNITGLTIGLTAGFIALWIGMTNLLYFEFFKTVLTDLLSGFLALTSLFFLELAFIYLKSYTSVYPKKIYQKSIYPKRKHLYYPYCLFLLSGFFAILAILMKFVQGIILAVIMIRVIIEIIDRYSEQIIKKKEYLKGLLLGIISFGVGFSIPMIIYTSFLSKLNYTLIQVYHKAIDVLSKSSWLFVGNRMYYLINFLFNSPALLIIYLYALLIIVLSFIKKEKVNRLLLSITIYITIMLIYFSNLESKEYRYLCTFFFPLIFLSGIIINHLITKNTKSKNPLLKKPVKIFVTILIVISLIASSITIAHYSKILHSRALPDHIEVNKYLSSMGINDKEYLIYTNRADIGVWFDESLIDVLWPDIWEELGYMGIVEGTKKNLTDMTYYQTFYTGLEKIKNKPLLIIMDYCRPCNDGCGLKEKISNSLIRYEKCSFKPREMILLPDKECNISIYLINKSIS